MYEMTHSGKLFIDELAKWLIEVGFIKSQWQMSIYDKYAPYGTIFLISYVDYCLCWYLSEAIGNDFWTL